MRVYTLSENSDREVTDCYAEVLWDFDKYLEAEIQARGRAEAKPLEAARERLHQLVTNRQRELAA